MKKTLCKYLTEFHHIDFRKEPERYDSKIGEQGVFMTQPYSKEIGAHWRFRTPEIAKKSAETIYGIFQDYVSAKNFVGADIARKYLMMGWTRSRRYANHSSGKKWEDGKILPQDEDSETSAKAESARIFKAIYDKARQDTAYLELKTKHKQLRARLKQSTQG